MNSETKDILKTVADLAHCGLFPVFLKEAWDLVTPIDKMPWNRWALRENPIPSGK